MEHPDAAVPPEHVAALIGRRPLQDPGHITAGHVPRARRLSAAPHHGLEIQDYGDCPAAVFDYVVFCLVIYPEHFQAFPGSSILARLRFRAVRSSTMSSRKDASSSFPRGLSGRKSHSLRSSPVAFTSPSSPFSR